MEKTVENLLFLSLKMQIIYSLSPDLYHFIINSAHFSSSNDESTLYIGPFTFVYWSTFMKTFCTEKFSVSLEVYLVT